MIQEMKGMITGRELVERLTDSIVVEEVEERGGVESGEGMTLLSRPALRF